LPGSFRPLLLSGGVLSRRRVRLVWCRQVKTAGLAREAGRRRMSTAGRVPGFGEGYVAGEGDLPAVALPAKRREGQRMFWLLHFAWQKSGTLRKRRLASLRHERRSDERL
jgi:hypothetical protein